MINIGLTIIFHREGALAVPALASMADMVVRNGNANVNPTRLDWLDCLDPDYALPAFAPPPTSSTLLPASSSP